MSDKVGYEKKCLILKKGSDERRHWEYQPQKHVCLVEYVTKQIQYFSFLRPNIENNRSIEIPLSPNESFNILILLNVTT
jgi:hypothetical protein